MSIPTEVCCNFAGTPTAISMNPRRNGALSSMIGPRSHQKERKAAPNAGAIKKMDHKTGREFPQRPLLPIINNRKNRKTEKNQRKAVAVLCKKGSGLFFVPFPCSAPVVFACFYKRRFWPLHGFAIFLKVIGIGRMNKAKTRWIRK